MYKKLLNRFSAPTHNYEFFVSQWTTLLYIAPSLVVVLYKVMKMNPLVSARPEVSCFQTIFLNLDPPSCFAATGSARAQDRDTVYAKHILEDGVA